MQSLPQTILDRFQRHVNVASAEHFAETNRASGTMLTGLQEVYQSGYEAREEVSRKWARMAGESDARIVLAAQLVGQIELIFNDAIYLADIPSAVQEAFKATMARTIAALNPNPTEDERD